MGARAYRRRVRSSAATASGLNWTCVPGEADDREAPPRRSAPCVRRRPAGQACVGVLAVELDDQVAVAPEHVGTPAADAGVGLGDRDPEAFAEEDEVDLEGAPQAASCGRWAADGGADRGGCRGVPCPARRVQGGQVEVGGGTRARARTRRRELWPRSGGRGEEGLRSGTAGRPRWTTPSAHSTGWRIAKAGVGSGLRPGASMWIRAGGRAEDAPATRGPRWLPRAEPGRRRGGRGQLSLRAEAGAPVARRRPGSAGSRRPVFDPAPDPVLELNPMLSSCRRAIEPNCRRKLSRPFVLRIGPLGVECYSRRRVHMSDRAMPAARGAMNAAFCDAGVPIQHHPPPHPATRAAQPIRSPAFASRSGRSRTRPPARRPARRGPAPRTAPGRSGAGEVDDGDDQRPSSSSLS